MDINADRTQAELHAVQFLVAQLIKQLPQERQDEMLEAAKARFTNHARAYDIDALVVIYAAFGKPGEWQKHL